MNIDMHVHTTASDGVLKPAQVIEWANHLGLGGVAITDHDTVDGIEEAMDRASNYEGFKMIPGIEFSTNYGEQEIHILGYYIDYQNNVLRELTNKIKNDRVERGKKIVSLLIKLGYNIAFEEVLSLSQDGAIGRPHIARILVQKDYVSSVTEAFEKLLGKGKAAYVERFKLTPQDAIAAIHEAKGIAVLAHPGLISTNVSLMGLLELGFDGIEVYHSKHSNDESDYYLFLAKKHRLFITGGSDYHDGFIEGIPTLGSTSIPIQYTEEVEKKILR